MENAACDATEGVFMHSFGYLGYGITIRKGPDFFGVTYRAFPFCCTEMSFPLA